MFVLYKWFYIEKDEELEKWKWCICELYQYLLFLKNMTDDENDWTFFDSLSDAKAYIDMVWK